MWSPSEHSDQENLRWSYLRAIEWGRWPIFISQIYAPLLLLFLTWQAVVPAVILSNILWAIFIRYRYVSVDAASTAAVLTRLKWVLCPAAAIYLFVSGNIANSLFALFWPVVIFVIGALPTVRVGQIQKMIMAQLGYESRTPTASPPSSEPFADTAQSTVAPASPLRLQRSAKVAACIRAIESEMLKRTLLDQEEHYVAELCAVLLQKALGDEKIVIRLVKLEWADSVDVIDAFRRAQDRWERDHNRFG